MTDKEKIHQILSSLWKNDDSVGKMCYNQALQDVQTAIDLQEEPVSEEWIDVAKQYVKEHVIGIDKVTFSIATDMFISGAKWQKAHNWKPADGDDLPEYDREVIVLVKYSTQRNIHDEEYPTYKVGFGHRPNPNGWDGKNIETNEVTHYTPKLYDKGGWNAPNIVYWLDAKLPYEENKIIK